MARGYVKLFQYGSNMNPTRLNAPQRLDGRAKSIGVARLDGWGIRFDLYSVTNKCAVTDIIPAKDEYVLGVLYDVPIPFVVARRAEPSRMDKIEGVKADGIGNYKRQIIRVTTRGGPVDAITYVGTTVGRKKFVSKTMREKQVSHEYFGNLQAGAKKFRLPKEYKSYLRENAGDLRE
jgi:Gamma-glutamyl cyclotransferase, AIG2-like